MKNILYLMLIFSLLAFSAPDSHTLASGEEKRLTDLSLTGERLIDEKKFDELIKVARDAIAEDPVSAPAWRFLVLGSYFGKKDLQKLEVVLKTSLSGKLKDAFVHYGLGYLYYLKGDLTRSEKQLRKSISMNPDVALARNNLGAVLTKQRKFEEALVHIRAALKIDPELHVAKNNLENTLLRMNPPTNADSLDELKKLLISALQEDNVQWLETLIEKNNNLILGNHLLSVQIVNALLDKGVDFGLSEAPETERSYFRLATILADDYYAAIGNESLQKRVGRFQDWSKKEKEKYSAAKKAYQKGHELVKQHNYNDARNSLNSGLMIYREIKDLLGEANSLKSLGYLHLILFEYESAQKPYEQALVIFREVRDRLEEANCLQGLGYMHLNLSAYESAREMYNKGLVIFREIKARLGEANCLQDLGDVHRNLYEYESARELYEQGLVIFREVKDRQGEANCLKRLGYLHLSLFEYESARMRYDQGLVIFREIKDHLEVANCLQGLGYAHLNSSEYESARERYEQGLIMYRELKNRQGEADCLKSLGDVHKSLYEYESARERYKRGLMIFRKIKNRRGEANCLVRIGEVYRMLTENESAKKYYGQGLLIFREIKDRLGEANCLKGLGDVHWILNESEPARDRYEQGLAVYREIKNRQGEANCLLSLGWVHRMLSEYESALELYEQGLVIFREIKNRQGEANCLKSQGDVHKSLYEYESARERYKQGLVIFREINFRMGEANCLQSLGDVHLSLSEYESARERYEQGLVIYREINDRLGEANCLNRLGDVHGMFSEYESAQKRYEQGLVIYREIKNRRGEANCLQSLGDMHGMLSQYEPARERFEQGLVIYRETKDRLGEANCLYRLGDVHRMLSRYESARERYEQGLVIYREINARMGEANCLQGLGEVYRVLSEYESAQEHYEQGLEIHTNIGDRNSVIETTYRLGQLSENSGDDTLAEEFYKKSIKNLEEVWGGMKTEEYKTSFFSEHVDSYEAMIALLFKTGKGVAGLDYAERSRARTFLYLLGNERIVPKRRIPHRLVREEEELRRNITLKSREFYRMDDNPGKRRPSMADGGKELSRLKKEHRDILFQIKLHSLEYAAMKSVNPLTGKEIQYLLGKDDPTILLEYYITDSAVYLWTIDGRNIRAHELNVKKDVLKDKVEKYRAMAGSNTFGVEALAMAASELYDLLLKPVESDLQGKDRFGITPHGVLHYLPFEALMKDNRFLTELGFKFFYLPSGSSYKFCKEKNNFKNEQLIAFGNPDGTLPFSEEETLVLKDLYTGTSEIFIGDQAGEGMVKDSASRPDILHFSSHGEYLPDTPLYSAILLGPDDANDGRLEVHEIFQLKLKPAYLVTLSACETKLGGIKPGDEIVGMTRAFIYAGTPSILASLWKVDDYYTAKLMVDFYRALKKHDKLDALHIARQNMMEERGKRHPFYWAAFVLSGDYR